MYTEIETELLSQIQEECLHEIKNHININENNFVWPKQTDILKLTTLNKFLNDINLYEHVRGVTFTSTTNMSSRLHSDVGNFRYSFNIPILNTENTYLTFYDCPPGNDKETTVPFIEYDKNTCSVIKRVETTKPAIIDTSVPHQYESYNDKPRVMILIRLKKEFELDNFLQK
jgi:hypothetical protein